MIGLETPKTREHRRPSRSQFQVCLYSRSFSYIRHRAKRESGDKAIFMYRTGLGIPLTRVHSHFTQPQFLRSYSRFKSIYIHVSFKRPGAINASRDEAVIFRYRTALELP